jgi:Phosphopantetheine attachment site
MVITSSLHSVSNGPQNSLPVRDAQNREFQSLVLNGNSDKTEGLTKTNKLCQSSVFTALVIKLASLIGVDPKEIKSTVPLSELGLDSFLASELQSVSYLRN